MDTSKYTWDHLLFTADILIQKGILSEDQLEKIIDIVDIKTLVKNNKLSKEFINKHIKPIIESDDNLSDYDSLTMYDVNRIQEYNHSEKIKTKLKLN